MLGELNEDNNDNWVKPKVNDNDVTTNTEVQVLLGKIDKDLWETMERATLVTFIVLFNLNLIL